MSQYLPHLKFPMGKVPISSNMFDFDNTGAGLNLGNLYNPKSFVEHHLNLELKISYLKDLDHVEPFKIKTKEKKINRKNEG